MTAATGLRPPGITFEAVPPELPDTLPRMDVAALVGFASAGPLHVPVVVEDVELFRQIFGPDAPLARDAGTGSVQHAHLGPAVEDFFRNGGRRCWVVRVADRDRAVRSVFALPGLVTVEPATGRWRLASARGRAVGGWADDLSVAPLLSSVALPPVSGVDPPRHRLTLVADAPLVVGDLLRLTFDGGHTVALVTVRSLRRAGAHLTVEYAPMWTLCSGWSTSVPPAPVYATRVTVTGEVELRDVPEVDVTDVPGRFVLTFGRDVPEPGDLLRITFDDGSVLAAPVAEPTGAGEGATTPSPPPGAARTLATEAAWLVYRQAEATLPDVEPPALGPPVAERLDLSLTVWNGERLSSRIDALGFASNHPRYWAALPTDEQMYALLSGLPRDAGRGGAREVPAAAASEPSGLPPLWAAAASPRFDLAGPADRDSGADPAGPADPAVWLPLALPDAAVSAAARGPLTDTASGTRMTRDGLAAFGAGLFLDPDLTDQGTTTLLDRAFAKSSIVAPTRPLLGIHALLPIDEVTLVAVPDAGHTGWRRVAEPAIEAPAPPRLWPPVARHGAATLWWTPVTPAATYLVERSGRPGFDPATVLLDGSAPLGPATLPGTGRVVGMVLPVAGCPAPVFLRVRARTAGGSGGPWSNTVTAVLPPADFASCARGLPPPILRLDVDPVAPGRGGWLAWTPEAELAVEIERSTDPGFARVDGRTLVRWAARQRIPGPGDAETFHRARLVTPGGGRFGPWSNTVVQPVPVRLITRVEEPVRGQVAADLLAVHRALVRMAAARGDLLAVLSMAAHYRERETLEHLSALTGFGSTAPELVRMLDRGEAYALSHAAVFHPWHVVRTVTGVRPTPPDGGVTGVIARRSIVRGAWVSPGYQPLDSVVSLTPALDADCVGRLLSAGVNVVAPRPAGFVTLAARTLSIEDTLAPIGVRRLMILLRRLALRHGNTYVFEPHAHRFRTMVRRTFDALLGELYQRGALAGAVPSEAFRVVADDSVNPEELAAAGRFVIELWVAPAQPLAFIRVRLVQSGAGDLTVMEV